MILASFTRISGPFDPATGRWPREPRPVGEVDQVLKSLTDMGYMKPAGGLRPFVDAHQEAEEVAKAVEIQLNLIESRKHGTGQKLPQPARITRS
jgi:hypothetical protein